MPPIELYQVPEGLNLRERYRLKRFKYTGIKFSGSEKVFLRKHGTAPNALWDGTMTPITQRQKHFVDACSGITDPNTEEERIWLKYVSMLSDEKRLADARRQELINSPEREEYIKSRLLP